MESRYRSRWVGWGVALSLAAAGVAAAVVRVDERRAVADAATPTRVGKAKGTVGEGAVVPAVDADEYAVYHALLEDYGSGRDQAVILVWAVTEFRDGSEGSDALRAEGFEIPGAGTDYKTDMEWVRKETMRSFNRRNRRSVPLVDRFGLGGRVVLVSERNQDGIDALYPDAPLLTISRVGFDARHQQAVVYLQESYGNVNADLVLLARDARGVFRVVTRENVWGLVA